MNIKLTSASTWLHVWQTFIACWPFDLVTCMVDFYCLLVHHSIALLVTTIMGIKKNQVGGVVRPRPWGILAGNSKELPCTVTTLLIDGNDIPPIDKEAKRHRTKVES